MKDILKNKLNEAIKASYRIKNLHLNLKRLEIIGLENSDEYKKIISYLEMAIESYKETIKEQRFNFGEFCEAYKFFYQNLFRRALYDYNEITDPNNFRNGNSQVFATIENKLRTTSHKEMSLTPLDVSEVKKISGNNAFINQDLNRDFETHALVSDDLMMTLLLLIEKFISNNPSSFLKDELIMIKYYLSFTNPTLEHNLINMNFKIKGPLFINNLELYTDISKQNERFYFSYYKKTFLESLLSRQINILSDDKIEKSDYELLIRQLLVKASLINFDVNSILNFQMFFETRNRVTKEKNSNDNLINDAIREGLALYSSEDFFRYKGKELEKTKKGLISE